MKIIYVHCGRINKYKRSSQLRTELVVKIRPEKKIQARTGFELMTSAIPVQRSTDWIFSDLTSVVFIATRIS